MMAFFAMKGVPTVLYVDIHDTLASDHSGTLVAQLPPNPACVNMFDYRLALPIIYIRSNP